MNFVYVAYDRNGRETRARIEAADEKGAREAIARQGLYVTTLRAESESARAELTESRVERPTKHTAQVPEFSRQLSILIATGTPLSDALAALARQSKDESWTAAVRALSKAVDEGLPLSDAMARRTDVFDAVGIALVAAGEASGRLDTMLGRYAKIARQQQAIQKAVNSAMIYPSILSTISLVVITVMLLFVIPRFEGMFAALGADLPGTTKILLSLSELLRARWYAVLPAVVVPIATAFWWLRTAHGARTIDACAVRAPLVGGLVRALFTARLARLLAVLLDAGIPLLEALGLTRRAMTNQQYRGLVDAVIADVTAGEPLASRFASSPLITPSFAQAVASAERSARLGEVLTGLAEHMDEDNHHAVKSLASLIEPVILIFMGVIVATVVISMFLPIFDLTASAGTAR